GRRCGRRAPRRWVRSREHGPDMNGGGVAPPPTSHAATVPGGHPEPGPRLRAVAGYCARPTLVRPGANLRITWQSRFVPCGGRGHPSRGRATGTERGRPERPGPGGRERPPDRVGAGRPDRVPVDPRPWPAAQGRCHGGGVALPVPAPRDAAAPAVQPSGVPARTSHVRTTLTSRLAAAAAAALVTLAGCAGPDLGATGPGPGDGPATAPAPLPTASPPTQIRDTPPAPAG